MGTVYNLISSGLADQRKMGMSSHIWTPPGRKPFFEMSGTRLQWYLRPVCRRRDRHLDHDGFPRVSCC